MLHSAPSTTSSQLSPSHDDPDSRTADTRNHSDTRGLSPLLQQCSTATKILVPPLGIPIELIDRILDFCDYSTFLLLARVNRFFNSYATEVLLVRELIGWRFKRISIPYPSTYTAQILAALNMRQFNTHTLTHVDYTFDARGCPYHQVDAMTRFFRNHVMSIDRLTLSVCFYLPTDWNVNDVFTCTSKLVLLLEAALAKGCQRFNLSGYLHSARYSPNVLIFIPPLPNCSRKQHRVRCVRWLQSYLPQPTPPPPPGPPFIRFPKPRIPAPSLAWESRLTFMTNSPSLTELEMGSSLMLIPPLLSHTLNLLRNQSPVLQKLKIHQQAFVHEEFFTTITLPVLETFAYTADYLSPELLDLLFHFLIRHPGIRTVMFPSACIHPSAEYPTFDANTLLPNLRNLYAHAKTISGLLRDPNAFLNLELVSFEAQTPYAFKQYGDVDGALVVLGSRMNGSFSDWKSPIHLEFNFLVDEDFHVWLSSHLINPQSSPIQHLKRVETLSVSLKDVNTKFKARHLDNLITWAGLFTNLKWLRLDGSFGDELYGAVRAGCFINILKDRCLVLKRCCINSWGWEKL